MVGIPRISASANFTPGDGLAVVEQHRDPGLVQLAGQFRGGQQHRLVLAGRHQVHVERRELPRPAQTLLVAGVLRDRGDRARDPDPVRAHGDRHELAVRVEHLESERLGVLAAELEDVAHLDAAGQLQRSGAVRRRVALPDLGRLDACRRG